MEKTDVLKLILQRYYHALLASKDSLTVEEAAAIKKTITHVKPYPEAKEFIDSIIAGGSITLKYHVWDIEKEGNQQPSIEGLDGFEKSDVEYAEGEFEYIKTVKLDSAAFLFDDLTYLAPVQTASAPAGAYYLWVPFASNESHARERKGLLGYTATADIDFYLIDDNGKSEYPASWPTYVNTKGWNVVRFITGTENFITVSEWDDTLEDYNTTLYENTKIKETFHVNAIFAEGTTVEKEIELEVEAEKFKNNDDEIYISKYLESLLTLSDNVEPSSTSECSYYKISNSTPVCYNPVMYDTDGSYIEPDKDIILYEYVNLDNPNDKVYYDTAAGDNLSTVYEGDETHGAGYKLIDIDSKFFDDNYNLSMACYEKDSEGALVPLLDDDEDVIEYEECVIDIIHRNE